MRDNILLRNFTCLNIRKFLFKTDTSYQCLQNIFILGKNHHIRSHKRTRQLSNCLDSNHLIQILILHLLLVTIVIFLFIHL